MEKVAQEEIKKEEWEDHYQQLKLRN
jgi:hypothetical protein